MVLYKRKRVSFMKPPDLPNNLKQEVYYIPATMEWFFNYEEYLERMDYYNRRKFVCEITGNSCLTYFEALNSEEKEIKGVEKNFPESLREHILRFLQFNRITRLDQLVDKVYLVFKNEYFPGENIYIRGMNNADDSYESQNAPKQRGTIREKVQYGQSDSLTTKYLVVRLSDMQQAIVTKDKISRDRNHFTKWLIKTFIKLTMSRSHKVGAPWVVKDKFAKKYRIPQEYPDDLKHFAYSTPTGEALYEDSDQGGSPTPSLNETKSKKQKKTPGPKGAKGKSALNNLIDMDDSISESGLEERFVSHADLKKKFQNHHLPDRIQSEVDAISGVSTPSNPLSSQSSLQPTKKNIVDDLSIKFDIQNTKPQPKRLELDYFNSLPNDESDDEMADDGADESIEPIVSVKFDSIQEGLQTWTFLNIYHNTLRLDTFTFDDFICAMNWNKIQFDKIGRCELLDEIWCAVLSAFVSNEIPSTTEERESEANNEVYGLLITIPNAPKSEYDVNNSSNGKAYLNGSQDLKHENSDDENIDYDEEEKNNGLSTQPETASEIKNEQDIKDEDNENMDEDPIDGSVDHKNDDEQEVQNAYNVMNYRNIPWHERLRRRNFKDGNWQCILLGVLSLVEHMPCYNELIKNIYFKLAPIEFQASPNTVLNQFYGAVDINLRLKILNLLIELLMNGNVVRNYIDECLEESTNLRRERLDCIREIKSLIETAQKQNVLISEITNGASNKDKSDLASRRLRLNFKITELNKEEQKLWDKNEDYKIAWDLRKESLIKIDEFNHTKKELEKKLNELDCQRVKLLGKDRLYNRYWWFENNGLPTLHGNSNDDEDDNEDEGEKNDESNAQDDADDILDETYLMGKLWVQGPSFDDMRIHLKTNINEFEDFSNVIRHNDVNFSVVRERCNEEANEESAEKNNTGIKELDFDQIPDDYKEAMKKDLGLYVYADKICVTNPQTNAQEELIDKFGGLLDPLSFQHLGPLQRKVIEELPDPLLDGLSWRYYDSPEEINKLIEWLNPWGKRESQLRKELINAKDAIIKNMNARSKAFNSMKEEDKEKELNTKLLQITSRIEQLESGDSDLQEQTDTSEPDQNAKRSLRSDLSARKKQKPSDGIDILKMTSAVDLRRMKSEFESKLSFEKRKKEQLKVLEWINSKAIDLYDKSLYEGGDKAKGRASRKSKNIK